MSDSKFQTHPFPTTRREFLAQGFLGFAGMSFLPSWLSPMAFGAPDCGPSNSGSIPVLVIDLAGGAALPANYLVTGKDDLLPSYDLLGWDPKESGALNETLGIPMSAKYSKILQGITTTASQAARDKFRMGGICHFAQSDTSSNLLSTVGWFSKYGVKGLRLKAPTGLISSASGGNSQPAGGTDFPRPLVVKTLKDLTGAVGFDPKGPFGTAKPEELKNLMRMAASLTEAELEKWQSQPEGKALLAKTKCSFTENEENLASAATAFDARKDAIFRQIYQINENSAENLPAVVSSSLVKGSLSGATGPTILTIGGCDYHDGTQTTGDNKDLEIGQAIGRAVEAAHQLKKPLFIQIITDGGCSNERGTRKWRSDDNDKCMTVVGYYKPEGEIKMLRKQVGYFNPGQSANLENLGGLGGRPAKVAAAVLANYLSLSVPADKLFTTLNTVIPSDTFTNQKEMESTLFFS